MSRCHASVLLLSLNTLFPPLLPIILVTPASTPTSLTHLGRSGPSRLASLCEPDKGASRCLSEFITFQTLPIGFQRAGCCVSEECRCVDVEEEIPSAFLPPPSLTPTAGMLGRRGGGLPVKCSHQRPPPTQRSPSLTATEANALNLICEPVHVLVWLTVCVLSVRNGIHQPLAPVGDPHFPNLDRPVSP